MSVSELTKAQVRMKDGTVSEESATVAVGPVKTNINLPSTTNYHGNFCIFSWPYHFTKDSSMWNNI